MRYISRSSIVIYVCAFLFLVVFIKNAWVSDDAYIIFRTLGQFADGNGAIWNPVDRVQTYTSALWFIVLAPFALVSDNFYLLSIVVGGIFSLGTLLIIAKQEHSKSLLFITLCLLSSNAFMDFTSSGLENSLIYFLMAGYFYTYYYAHNRESIDNKAFLYNAFFTALLLITRHDLAVLLFIPTVSLLLPLLLQKQLRQLFTLSAIILTPLILWTLFSTIYYGIPVPNTSLAKLNIHVPLDQKIEQGLMYFWITMRVDSLSFFVILAGTLLAMTSKVKGFKSLGLGLVLFYVYLLYVGADFMRGRFLSHVFLLALLICNKAYLAEMLPKLSKSTFNYSLSILVLFSLFYPHTPVNSPYIYHYMGRDHGITDERGIYSSYTSIWHYLANLDDPSFPSTFPGVTEAIEKNKAGEKYWVQPQIGIKGYWAGNVSVIDYYALADPFITKLPKANWVWAIGHTGRYPIKNYPEAYATGDLSLIEDPDIRQMAEHVFTLTRSRDFLSAERIKTIINFNLGRYDTLITESKKLKGTIRHRKEHVSTKNISCYHDQDNPLLNDEVRQLEKHYKQPFPNFIYDYTFRLIN